MFNTFFKKIKSKFSKIFLFSILTISKSNATKIPTEKFINPYNSPALQKNITCPPNATCVGHIKKIYLLWNNLIEKLNREKLTQKDKTKFIKNFHAKYGILVNLWTKEKKVNKNLSLAIWDSPNQGHQAKDLKVFQAEGAIKNTKDHRIYIMKDLNTGFEAPLNKMLYLRPILTLQDNLIEKFYIPINDLPSHFENHNLIIFKEYEGVYYNLSVSKNGNWHILTPKQKTGLSEQKEIKCPIKLIDYFKKKLLTLKIYQQFYCKKMSDLKTDKNYTVLIPWIY